MRAGFCPDDRNGRGTPDCSFHLPDWKCFRGTLSCRPRARLPLIHVDRPDQSGSRVAGDASAPYGGDMSKRLATLLVALALSGCATAPPPPAYVSKTLV